MSDELEEIKRKKLQQLKLQTQILKKLLKNIILLLLIAGLHGADHV